MTGAPHLIASGIDGDIDLVRAHAILGLELRPDALQGEAESSTNLGFGQLTVWAVILGNENEGLQIERNLCYELIVLFMCFTFWR